MSKSWSLNEVAQMIVSNFCAFTVSDIVAGLPEDYQRLYYERNR